MLALSPIKTAEFACAAVLACLVLALAGCGGPDYENTYTTRGIVRSLPGDKATQEFIIHHEEIPEYVRRDGGRGMNEMAMPLPVPDRSILEGVRVGDKVELTWGESFVHENRIGVISIRPLPDDTELDLHQATRPAAEEEPEPEPSYEQTHNMRGIIRSLPGERATEEFLIHHEAVPTYHTRDSPEGLREMVMPLSVPDPSILEGIEVGDKVELIFGVRLAPHHVLEVVSLRELPADTPLNISEPGGSE